MISKHEKELHGTHHDPVVNLTSRSRAWYIAFSIAGYVAWGLFSA